MSRNQKSDYLKTELYQKVASDPLIFDWIEAGAADGIWYWDLENQENEYLSPSFKNTFGYEDHEIENSSLWWQQNINPDDLKNVQVNVEKHIQDPEVPFDQVVRYPHKSGGTIYVRCRGLAIRDHKNKPTRMLGVHTNVTEIFESQKESKALLDDLTESNMLYDMATHAGKIGIWTWDIVRGVIDWNQMMFKLYGITESEFTGQYKDWADRVHPEDLLEAEEQITQALQGNYFNSEFRIVLCDRSTKYIKASARVMRNKEGKPIKMIGSNIDITDLRRRESELESKNHDLEQFIRLSSHDLKAPLHGILTVIDWIKQDSQDIVSESLLANFKLIENRASRMKRLLDDLVEYCHIESIKQQVVSFRLKLLVDEIDTKLKANYPNVNLSIQCKDLMLSTCMVHVESCLTRILDNCYKHAGDEDIIVKIRCSLEGNQYQLTITDDGAGIPADFIEKAGQMFTSLRPKDIIEGNGVGLGVVSRLMKALDGAIHIDSDIDRGTKVTLIWPKN
jgi:PAS domain S-box-containing protein